MSLEGTQLGNYRLLQPIGSGGMGEVYLAEDTRIHRQVAIKVIRDEVAPYPDAAATREATRLFQREMKAISQLDHPHILPLFDFGEESINQAKLTYMVIPYRQEGSLADWLQKRGTTEMLSPQNVGDIVSQAADALQHAHDHHLVHQDVKPSNFLIRSRSGQPNRPDLLLSDFGIAKFTTATATTSQSIRGTPAYMAPEQWDGQPLAATDQYALAVMAYQLLTGRPPFVGSPGQVMRQHFQAQPQPPSALNPRIPAALDAVIQRALEKQPEERYGSIAEFAAAFQQALADAPPAGLASAAPPLVKESPPPVTRGDDIRATLAISQKEATTGVSRMLNLPNGRRILATVPAKAYNGQIIRLEGFGEPSSAGGRAGALILILAVHQEDEPDLTAHVGDDEQTVRGSNPALPQTRVSPSERTPIPPTELAAATRSEAPTIPAPPFSSTRPVPPPRPPAGGSNKAARSMSSAGKITLVIVLVVLVFGSGLGIIYLANHPGAGTAGSGSASLNPADTTATAQANATATVVAANVNPYPPHTGTLVLYDPLSDNSHGYGWKEDSGCEFTGGNYFVIETKSASLKICYASTPYYSSTFLAFQVQMTISRGDCGGLVFDYADNGSQGGFGHSSYYFAVCQNGTFAFRVDLTGFLSGLTRIASSAINTGLNQTNLIAVVASGDTLNFYVNNSDVYSVQDSTYNAGTIGVTADTPDTSSTYVLYNNAKVWTTL